MMRKKLVGLLMLVMCLVLSLGAFAACNNTPDKPEGGSWTCYSENKIWTKNLMLKFEDEETFKVYSGSDQWIVGKYKFEKNPGTSTLTLWGADVAIPDVEKDGEKTYEPIDGVYTIEFDHGAGGKSKFLFQPPQDGTKPGQGGEQPNPPCDTHVDENKDGKCDKCGEDMPNAPSEKTTMLTLNGKGNMLPEASIVVYSDNTFDFNIPYVGGKVFGGTWVQESVTSPIILTVDDAGKAAVGETIEITFSGDYPNINYVCSVNYAISEGVTDTLNFSGKLGGEDETPETHYTVKLDLNFDNAPKLDDVTTSTFTVYEWKNENGIMKQTDKKLGTKEYIKDTPSVPQREGYKFAGWDTVKSPVLKNGISETQYLFGEKIEMQTASSYTWLPNDVMEISEDITLYARWVEKTPINTASDLIKMAQDLNGWYELTTDITLTEEWEPVGSYYGNYELLKPDWWQYAFHGTLDGNGHSLKGLKITALNRYDNESNAITELNGSRAGTAALFGAAVNATIKNLTIDAANIDVQYSNHNHAYLSIIAGFVHGGLSIEKCKISNSSVKAQFTDICYVAVASAIGGHWAGTVSETEISNTSIDVKITQSNATYDKIYVGGLVGEGYGWLEYDTLTNVNVNLSFIDNRSQKPETDICLGGIEGTSTYLKNMAFSGKVNLDYTKCVGKANVNIGGISGYQRYGYVNDCLSQAIVTSVSHNTAIVEGQTFVYGGIVGNIDAMMGMMGTVWGLHGCPISHCLDLSTFTKTGTENYITEGSVGQKPDDYATRTYATMFQVNLADYTREDGTLNFFGVFNSVKLGNAQSDADVDGNIVISEASAAYGEALKTVLGSGWTYNQDEVPCPISKTAQ